MWCIGYSGRSIEEFLEKLRENRIELVVDIRRFPVSKFEAYRRDRLAEILAKKGIAYLWLGDLLGGYRTGGFENYMKTDDFKRGLKRLIEEAAIRRTCIMCLERKQRYCHRRFIAKALEEEGFEVLEIP
ncbi:MAG: hypothetical protein AYL29_009750 [Candidatus Bathyarchaeota archaeon B24]|nr:MAG: hypothetical protein AYL29_009750 [Candidatus Bathyarchaeota archaeon B24]